MGLLSLFDFICFLIYSGLGTYILVKNPEAPLNRIFFGITCCFAVWSFASVFYDDPHASKETARLSLQIGSLGWLSFGSFALLFCVYFTEKNHVVPLKKLVPVLIAVPGLLIYQQWQNESLISEMIKLSYGWSDIWRQSGWTYLFFAYFALTTSVGLLLVVEYWRNTDNPDIKHQAAIICITGLFALIVGSVTNITLPILHIHDIPALGHLSLLVWVCGIAYVIVRYRFLTVTPATAAENLLSTMTDALILMAPTGKMITVNKAACNMLGDKKEDLEGRMFEEVFASRQNADEILENLISTDALKNEEHRFITREGSIVPVMLSATALKDERQKIVGIICVARDIRERIEMQKRMFAVLKLESIRSLAGGIAHEYNNKLSVLSCNVDLIRLKLAGKTAVEKNLKSMKTAITQISDLTAQLVAYAREGKYQPDALDINGLIEATLPAFRHSGQDEIRVENFLDKNLPKVMADAGQMQMVLHIILSNASEAMSGKGQIDIRAADVLISEAEAGLKDGFRPGHYVRLTVKDDGKGMDEQTLSRIFDPFFSTKIQGRGLSMPAAYGILKNHEGFIYVTSEIGKGTSVSIYLPAERKAA